MSNGGKASKIAGLRFTSAMTEIEVLGIEHVDLTVNDLAKSAEFHEKFFADPDGIKLESVHFPRGYWRKVQEQGHDERPRHLSK